MALTNVFRTDGWVKSAQGPAVPGAQVYVCLQPANIASLPPTPLANIFSDVNGLVPLSQPIITDGFGHYDFYAAANVYTVIVGLGGLIQQVYPDQSVGGASGTSGGGGGTALNLQVNGTSNVNQLLLNLVGKNGVAVADAGNGTINITGSVFQTNSIPNTLQSVLNLKSGSGITVSSDAVGGVTITNSQTQGPVTGQNVWPSAANGFASSNFAQGAFGGNTCANCLPGRLAYCLPSSWKVTFQPFPGNTTNIDACTVAVTAADSGVVTSVVSVTFNGGSTTASFNSELTSDPINLQIAVENDYYLLIYFDNATGDPGYWQNFLVPASGTCSLGAQYSSVNNTNPVNVLTTHTPSTDGYCFFKKITVT